jgi:hypothetical protein
MLYLLVPWTALNLVDHAQITGIAAAHVGYELLSALASRKL